LFHRALPFSELVFFNAQDVSDEFDRFLGDHRMDLVVSYVRLSAQPVVFPPNLAAGGQQISPETSL